MDANPAKWLAERNANVFVGWDKFAVSLGTYSSAVKEDHRKKATKLWRDFAKGIDTVFCQKGGLKTFCSPGAKEPSMSFGGTPPIFIFPCDQSYLSKSDCVSDPHKQDVTWLVE